MLMQANLDFPHADSALRHVLGEESVAQALRFDPSRAAGLIAQLDAGRASTGVYRVRVALLEGDDRDAAAMLEELPAPVSRKARVERAVLAALSLLDRDIDRANAALGDAIRTGQPEWLVRTVVEHGPRVHKLLASYTPATTQEPYLARLLSAAVADVAPVRAEVVQALIDPLTARELTVLRYLCSRLTNVEIARALYVSINTLKSHVRTVYRKLDVASREDAVTVGRQLGLI
jgi:LuxR family maltose regulon positive regulatory protein